MLSHLLGVVDEGVVGVDKEDVLRLQVGVGQLVVMENCWEVTEGEERGERRDQRRADDRISTTKMKFRKVPGLRFTGGLAVVTHS